MNQQAENDRWQVKVAFGALIGVVLGVTATNVVTTLRDMLTWPELWLNLNTLHWLLTNGMFFMGAAGFLGGAVCPWFWGNSSLASIAS